MKKKSCRMIDANINRISEGLRVIEDVARFDFESIQMTEALRTLRHKVRKTIHGVADILDGRDSLNDPGVVVSAENRLDQKESLFDLVSANFKRVQEGLRVVEEALKIAGYYEASKLYEAMRFESYTLESRFKDLFRKSSRKHILDSDLYCLTSEEHSKGRTNIDVVGEMLKAGITLIQYREKNKSMLEKYREAETLRQMTREAGARFIVNDHVDLAVAVEADGVHLGQEDLPIEAVRRIIGEKMAIGLSTHSMAQAEKAVRDGADYIGVGPIFKTYTKKDVCDPVGFEYLDLVVQKIEIPFVAIGGVKEGNIRQVREHGASCIALVTEIVGADNIPETISRLRKEAGFING